MNFQYANILFSKDEQRDHSYNKLIKNNKLFNLFYTEEELKKILLFHNSRNLNKKLELIPMNKILDLYKDVFESKGNNLVDESKCKLHELISIGNFLNRIFLEEIDNTNIKFNYKCRETKNDKIVISLDIECEDVFDFSQVKEKRCFELSKNIRSIRAYKILHILQNMFSDGYKCIPNNFSEVIHNETLKMLIKSWLVSNFDKIFDNYVFRENFYKEMYLIHVNILDFDCELVDDTEQSFCKYYNYDCIYNENCSSIKLKLFKTNLELVFGTLEDREKYFFKLEDDTNIFKQGFYTIPKSEMFNTVWGSPDSPTNNSGEATNIERQNDSTNGIDNSFLDQIEVSASIDLNNVEENNNDAEVI